ncbi:GDCCVxC domain-containing (seleno)protein [Rhodoferax sp. GW822-FHT02A01]|uniref:GDCCVxC domain-containing (seleno)protein n=1 Tax=Rhodoferax sp. GW822-FHT02A01 TaxID=3141537 RepID=UPI00315DBC21
MDATIQTKSVLTCPECGHKAELEMPSDACQFFYECEACKAVLRPLAGECCVFCSYGTVKCPPIQEALAGDSASSCCKGCD